MKTDCKSHKDTELLYKGFLEPTCLHLIEAYIYAFMS